MEVVKRGSSYAVEGNGDGWIFKRTFSLKWKAKLAIEVFERGGRVPDYWGEVKEEQQIRKARRLEREGEVKEEQQIRELRQLQKRRAGHAKLLELIIVDPENAEARLRLAFALLRVSSPGYWETWHIDLASHTTFTPEEKTAKEQLNIALAIGLVNPLDAAKAKFLLMELLLSGRGSPPWKSTLDSYPDLKVLARAVVSDSKKHLRRFPHDVEALCLQRLIYKMMEDYDGLGRVELALSEAQSLKEAGLIGPKISQSRRKARRKDGLDLEMTTERLLHAIGLRASITKVTGDGGIDIIAYSESPIFAGKYIIQCKDWTNPVGEPVIRDLFGVVVSEGANKGILITTGSFTDAAKRFAEGKPVELIDGNGLRRLLERHAL